MSLLESPLKDLHTDLGAKMVDFNGWSMPIHYGSQVDEHNSVRSHSGWFDVSHMTIVDMSGEGTRSFLRQLLANDVAKLDAHIGKALYSVMLQEDGGVIDDLIVYFIAPDAYRLVLNCATREKDLAWIRKHAPESIVLNVRDDLALIAVQGPKAIEGVASALSISLDGLKRFHSVEQNGFFIARTGYTGEDGLEIAATPDQLIQLSRQLFDAGVAPCGLGARDTLRLEAGLNLYGQDMDESVLPQQANLSWTLSFSDREFFGKKPLEAYQGTDCFTGVQLEAPGVLRAGISLFIGDEQIGFLTSGGFSPTLKKSIGMARMSRAASEGVEAEIRGKRKPVSVQPLPFYKPA